MRVERRLWGSGNLIHWSDADIERICSKFGVGSVPHAADPYLRRDVSSVGVPPLPSSVKADDGKAVSFVISTATVDRMGDTVNLDGWRTDSFNRNPVVLWAHDHFSPPIGRATKVWKEGGALRASMTFASSGFAQAIKTHVKERTLTAKSVGFRPLKWSFSKDPERAGGIDFHEQELLEFSIVSVPANPDALVSMSAEGVARQRRRERLIRERELLNLKYY